MQYFRPSIHRPPELHPEELTALRHVYKNRPVEVRKLKRLKELGLVEQKAGVWATTQQGKIQLAFSVAR